MNRTLARNTRHTGDAPSNQPIVAEKHRTHRGRPFQSAYRGCSIPTNICGYCEVNLSLSLSEGKVKAVLGGL